MDIDPDLPYYVSTRAELEELFGVTQSTLARRGVNSKFKGARGYNVVRVAIARGIAARER